MMSFLKKLFGSGAESADGYLRRGVGLFKEKKYDRAIAAFTEVIRLDPANGQAYRWRAQAYALSGNQAKADSDYDRAGELTAPVPTEKPVGPALVKAMSFRMGNYESEADCDQAIRDITEAPAWVRENNPPAFHNRGYAFYQKGEYARAAEDFSAAIPLCRPGDAYIPLRMRGMAYLRLGEYRESIADFTQVLALEPDDAHAYACRGTVFNELGVYDRAIADCTEAIRLNADSLLSYISRGFSYSKKSDHAHAIADYSEAIRLDPENPALYEDRARAYRAIGDEPHASEEERKAQGLRR